MGISEGYKVKDIHSLVKCNAVSTEQHSTVIRTSFCRSRRALLHSASFCFNLFNTTGMVPAGFLRRRSRISVAWSPYSLFEWWRKEWRSEGWVVSGGEKESGEEKRREEESRGEVSGKEKS